jgi:hypothetical protein
MSRLAVVLLAAALAAAPASAAAPRAEAGRLDRALRTAARVLTDMDGPVGRVYFPVITANPNAGVTLGVMPIWLLSDARRGIRHIAAPMFTYNPTFGAAFSGSYYYYPSARSSLRAILEKAERTNQRAALRYESLEFLDGRCVLKLDANTEADGTPRFFGIGPASPKAAETSYRLEERHASAEVGVKYWGSWQAAVGWKYRRTEVRPGIFKTASEIPQDLRTSATYSTPRLALSRDTRDLPATPGRGSLTELFAELSARVLGGSSDHRRYGGQWRAYLPQAEALSAALHAQMEWAAGEVPFTALAALGGPRSLRAFPEGRFQDRGAVFVNFEERWALHRLEVVNALTEFQVAPFIEAGTVFHDADRIPVRRVQTVAGVGFRAVVKPTVVGKVDVGVGREGPAVYVGIDYPF